MAHSLLSFEKEEKKMIFNNHTDLTGSHATFSASQSSWLRYDDEKMVERLLTQYRSNLGTELHEYACQEIKLGHKQRSKKGIKDGVESYIYQKYYEDRLGTVSEYGDKLLHHITDLPMEVFDTVRSYVNDGIGYQMRPEQVLYYSPYFFGTTDCICFRDHQLRIHDLKTGSLPAHMEQLEVYAALFCLEYEIRPNEIDTELRIYQNGEILYHKPEPNDILAIIDQIIHKNKIITKYEN